MNFGVSGLIAKAPVIFRQIANKPFSRNVALMVGGSVIAQGIVIGSSPIITRIYGPEAFGILGVFLSVTEIFAPLASLGYAQAIVLPGKHEEAVKLFKLSVWISFVFTGLVSLGLAVAHEPFLRIFELEVIRDYLPMIPLFLLLNSLTQSGVQWLIRMKRFYSQSRITVTNALVLNAAKIGFGVFSPTAATLVILATAGTLINAAQISLGARGAGIWVSSQHGPEFEVTKTYRQIAKEYSNFPKFRAPQMLLNTLSRNLPVLILAMVFSPAVAGFYALGHRILLLPSELVGRAVASVFLSRFTEAVHRRENLRAMLLKTTFGLCCLGAIPFGLVAWWGPGLFSFVFGSEWATAGELARWMSILLFLNFVARPCSQSLQVQHHQKFLLVLDLVSTGSTAVILFVGGHLLKNQLAAVACYSLFGALYSCVLMIKGFRSAGEGSPRVAP